MLTERQQRVLDRLPMPIYEWEKVHRKTRRSLVAKNLVIQDMFGNVVVNPSRREVTDGGSNDH